MEDRILVTGGCGFIGSHLVDRLIQDGQRVCVLDSLTYQVHDGRFPEYLNPEAEYVFGDMLDESALDRALSGVSAVFHLAATVGVGQSMYQIDQYTRANTQGTARLVDRIVNNHSNHVAKVVVASSMSVYGEGTYSCLKCGVQPGGRSVEQLAKGDWEPRCSVCGLVLSHLPTPEEKVLDPRSVYALNKMDQEKLCLLVGRAYSIPAVALRFFNVYGPRQALSNPYTGVAAIFSSRIKSGRAPVVYEDGHQMRDFVSVHDIVQACLLVLRSEAADYRALNVGSGKAVSVLDVARTLGQLYGVSDTLVPEVPGRSRTGDIRHCYADISAIQELGYSPTTQLEEGLADLADWSDRQQANDNFEQARRELESKGLA